MKPPMIVVGVDGSEPSRAAVEWAANEAARRGDSLKVISAYDWRVAGALAQIPTAFAEKAQDDAESAVAAAIDLARDVAPGITVDGEAALGAPGPVLVGAAKRARAVVVGNRGRGGLASVLLGSVSQYVATHAEAPVVVVRGRPHGEPGPVVVGVDGSAAADAALGIALEEAAIRGTRVLAVRAYTVHYPPSPRPPIVNDEDPVQRRENEQRFLRDDVAAWQRQRPDVPLECVVVEGHAGEVLAGLSESADLVVVGMRGHGGLGGLLAGSVGLYLLHHAASPVLIARSAAVSAAAAA